MKKWKQKDRGTSEYDGPCRDCLVLDHIVCPIAEKAYDHNRKMVRCEFAKGFGEQIIRAITWKYGNQKNKRA